MRVARILAAPKEALKASFGSAGGGKCGFWEERGGVFWIWVEKAENICGGYGGAVLERMLYP